LSTKTAQYKTCFDKKVLDTDSMYSRRPHDQISEGRECGPLQSASPLRIRLSLLAISVWWFVCVAIKRFQSFERNELLPITSTQHHRHSISCGFAHSSSVSHSIAHPILSLVDHRRSFIAIISAHARSASGPASESVRSSVA